MKKLFLLFSAAMAFSCSDIDSPPDVSNSTKLASVVTYNNGLWTSIFNLAYDTNQRLAQIVEHREFSDVDNVFTLTYDANDRLLLIDKMGQEHHTVALTYDDTGKVSSWSLDEAEPRSVTYEQGIYTVSVANIEIFHAYDTVNDITMIDSGSGVCSFNYDVTKNGAFKNVVGNYQLFGLFMDSFILWYGSKKALLSTTTSPFYSYTCINTYDEDGYITGFTGAYGDGRQPWATITYTE